MIRILLADDQDLLCEFLQTSLESKPDLQIVGRANNGQVVLEKTDMLRPDIVLIDINMPVMDGLTATEKIVQNFPETKVIVLSGSDVEFDRVRAINAGAKSFIPKTAKAEEIVSQIRLVHQKGHIASPESNLTGSLMQIHQAKQEIKQYLEKSNYQQKKLSAEVTEFKSTLESLMGDLHKIDKESIRHSTEINRVQTLVEGQLSYVHSLKKRNQSLRKYLFIVSAIAGISLLFSIISLLSQS